MTILQAIILGFVEGITEFLPISSTAHLVIASNFLHIPQTESLKSFEIAIQLGAILSVATIFIKELFSIKNIKLLVAGFLPTAILGLILYKPIKIYVFGNLYIIATTLILGGVLILWVEKLVQNRKEYRGEIYHKDSILLGFCQAVAFLPGVSRSGAIIVSGLLLGYSREVVMKFAFMLAVPTMAAATGYDVLKSYKTFSSSDIHLILIGFTVAFITAYFSVSKLLHFVKNNTFRIFGYYRIIIGLILLASLIW